MRVEIDFPDGTYLIGAVETQHLDLDDLYETTFTIIDDDLGRCYAHGYLADEITII